jgi:PPM family protein phosphatase
VRLFGHRSLTGERCYWIAAVLRTRAYYIGMLTAHGVTHRGHVRSSNEDAWLSALDLGLFVVADGMGGQNAGEVASSLAVDTIRTFIDRTRHNDAADWPFGVDQRLSPGANRILTALKLANRRIFESGEDIERRGMGTTVVAALIEQRRLIFTSVGDSRIYSWRQGALSQLTADDSWISELLANQPEVDPAALRHHPMRSVLTNVVGPREALEVKVHERALDDQGEVLLLCSDGLHGALRDADIRAVLSTGADAIAMAEQLVAAALAGPASDNITALVVRDMP